MKLFQWHFSLYLIPLAFLLPVNNANAAPIVTCSASISNIDFGSIDLLSNNRFTTTGTVNYSCTNTGDAAQDLTLCISLGNEGITPRAITPVTPGLTNLPFQMYTDSGYNNIWGSIQNPTTKEAAAVNVTVTANGGVQRGAMTVYAAIPANQSTRNPSTYKINYQINNTLVTSVAGLNKDCGTSLSPLGPGVTPTQRMNPFYVQAIAPSKCLINSKSNINFGNKPSSATNIESVGTNPINLTCTNGTVYNIGLAPSNGSTVGLGAMKGTTGNNNQVPYQLRSTTGVNGTVWGNTATSSNVGNGVTANGTGSAQNRSVYATVPSADFRPDNYSDIVTININY
ncbi:spore coat protein U domain-containing protein [Psychrobacter sp. BF1]|uniref:Csu type fimbrial protein n=1 Tax=Psychrobacter sp. BF1 TaxID=2821147 RepID=UPI001C4E0BE6|nr:spore coat protein U domain-containing protein [Psychrobacter sp. BF1]